MLSRSSFLTDGGSVPNVIDSFSLAPSVWHRIELAIASGAPPIATLRIDGVDKSLSADPRLAVAIST